MNAFTKWRRDLEMRLHLFLAERQGESTGNPTIRHHFDSDDRTYLEKLDKAFRDDCR